MIPQNEPKKTPVELDEKLKRLEAIVRGVEHAGSGLTEALALVEEGVVLSEEIEQELSRSEIQVQKLIERIRPRES